MRYSTIEIPDHAIPRATAPHLQHALDTYAGETNKTASVWAAFTDADLDWKPHVKSSSVRDILKHQLLSERRFFGEFLDVPEPAPGEVLPAEESVETFRRRLIELARPRLDSLAGNPPGWWLQSVPFFDVSRERIWVFWRRLLHTAHHRTQLTVYLRLLNRPTPPTYGPTADVSWEGADPTTTVDAAGRR